MKKLYLLALSMILFVVSAFAQSLTIPEGGSFKKRDRVQVYYEYKDEFGKHTTSTGEFPYAAIVICLDGDIYEVQQAKQLISLDLGTRYVIQDKITNIANKIVFLVPAAAGHVKVVYGNNTTPIAILKEPKLENAAIYEGRLHYQFSEDMRLGTFETYLNRARVVYAGYRTETDTKYFVEAIKVYEDAITHPDCPAELLAQLEKEQRDMKLIRKNTYQYQELVPKAIRRTTRNEPKGARSDSTYYWLRVGSHVTKQLVDKFPDATGFKKIYEQAEKERKKHPNAKK